MSIKQNSLQEALKHFFGFSTFKGLQEPVIESIMSGTNTFVIMPTGGGKSLCYQLPALMQSGTAIVVSPLRLDPSCFGVEVWKQLHVIVASSLILHMV